MQGSSLFGRRLVGPHFQGGHPQLCCVSYESRRDSPTVIGRMSKSSRVSERLAYGRCTCCELVANGFPVDPGILPPLLGRIRRILFITIVVWRPHVRSAAPPLFGSLLGNPLA